MITSQGMLVCSFNLKQRFSRGEENVYPLNQQYELKLEFNLIVKKKTE